MLSGNETAMSSKRFKAGDDGYEAIRNDWIANGRPFLLERSGSWGGALYRSRVPEGGEDDYPDFYMFTSMGPTLISDYGKVTQDGWTGANWQPGYSIQFRQARDASGVLYKVLIKEMPNELE